MNVIIVMCCKTSLLAAVDVWRNCKSGTHVDSAGQCEVEERLVASDEGYRCQGVKVMRVST